MNFRFFDDLVGSAPGESQKFRFREGKHSAKHYSANTIEILLENLTKILRKNLRNLENFLLIFKFFSDNVEHFE